jgi:FkbM family methyltransferase
MDIPHTIEIGGRAYAFTGEAGDFYADNLPAFAQGRGEQELLRFAARHLTPHSVCLDVGANIGFTALALGARCAHVYAFEPSPKNAGYLRHNCRQNGIVNVTVVDAAVGARDGTTPLFVQQTGANCVVVRDHQSGRPSINVPLVALDTWAGGRHVDFLKIDTEGYEAHVLYGAAGLIVRCRPLIFMEFNSVTIAGEARRSPVCFAETLWRAFDVFSVDGNGELQPEETGPFIIRNMVQHGCLDDVVLKVKPALDAAALRDILQVELG